MEPDSQTSTLDFIAKAQLALVHAAVARPVFDWEMIQHLVDLWQTTNALRYLDAGLRPEDVQVSLRMVFRDYVQEVREENPEEAERLRSALGPEWS